MSDEIDNIEAVDEPDDIIAGRKRAIRNSNQKVDKRIRELKTKLNKQRQLFALYYCKCFNATLAAKEAGFAEKSAAQYGYLLLKDPQVMELVELNMVKAMDRLEIDVDRVLLEAARIAVADISDVVSWNKDGIEVYPSSMLTKNETAAIAEVAQVTTQHGISIKVKMHNKNAAIELLGKYFEVFKDHVLVKHQSVKQILDEIDGQTRGLPGR